MAYSTSWRPVNAAIGHQPINATSTVAQHPLGTIVRAWDYGDNRNGEGEFIYVKGVTNGAVGSWVGINLDDGSTTLAVADGYYPLVGVLMSALSASTLYGWAQISGKAVGKAEAGFADNGMVYLTATPGSVDDTAVPGDLVQRALGASALDAPATGMAEFELSRPHTDNDEDDNLGP